MEDDSAIDPVARLLDFVERSGDLVGMLDGDGRVVYMNETAHKSLGYGDIEGLTAADLFTPDTLARYYDEIRPVLLRAGAWSGDAAIRTQAGVALSIWCELIADVAPGGEIRGLVTHGRVRDRRAHAMPRRDHHRIGIVEVALRDVDEAGATLDALTIEGVQRAAARRLALHVRASDRIVRVDDDRFVVVLEEVRDAAELMRHAHALQQVFAREPISVAAGEVIVAVDVRPALGGPGATADQVLARTGAEADHAWYEPLPNQRPLHNPAASEALQLAVIRGEIATHVRPVVDRQGDLTGYAAFATWSRRDFGAFESDALYALADDEPGIRAAIDLRVLREAAAVAATSPGTVPVHVFAPIGAPLLDDVYLEQYTWEIADSTRLSADQIHLMVDDALVGDQHAKRRDTLRSLRDGGYAIVVTGIDHSADVDALIRRCQPSALRIRDDAVTGIVNGHDRVAFERLVDACHDRGVRVIAPGIDTPELRNAALEIGIDCTTGEVHGTSMSTDSIV